MVEMKLESVTTDSNSKAPVLILEEKEESESKRLLLIWVGESEAWAIDSKLKNESMPRPMTHDLMKNILDALSATVIAIHINAFKDATYYATLKLKSESEEYDIDSRPSDAIALALRCDVPIYIDEAVLEQNGFMASEVKKSKEMNLELSMDSYVKE